MSQVEVERFLGRLITDADFRTRASSSLKNACYNVGVALSAEEMSFLGSIDFRQFGHIAETLDDSIRRS
jgi:hypothetical protein